MTRKDFYIGISILIFVYTSLFINNGYSFEGLLGYYHFLTEKFQLVFFFNFVSIVSFVVLIGKSIYDMKKNRGKTQ